MKTKYGNTFNSGAGDSLSVSVEALWIRADVFAPLGGYVKVDATNTVGKKIPAGTIVELGKPGEAPNVSFCLGNDKPVAVYAYCNLHGLWKTAL